MAGPVRRSGPAGPGRPQAPRAARRRLDQDVLKTWPHRSWIFITDPDFRPKSERVLGLYARTWDGIPLGADEKTSIRARRERCG